MAQERTLDVAELIEGRKLGSAQIWVALLLCTLMALEGYDMQTLSFAAPAILQEWGVSRAEFGVVLFDRAYDRGHRVDGVNSLIRPRSVRGSTESVATPADRALMSNDNVELRWLGDDRKAWSRPENLRDDFLDRRAVSRWRLRELWLVPSARQTLGPGKAALFVYCAGQHDGG